MTLEHLLISIFTVTITFTAPMILLISWSLYKKVTRLTNKQAAVVWACMLIYYAVFFTQGHKIIPENWKPVSTQEMVCELKTIYKERK